jgi:hypothetical protein
MLYEICGEKATLGHDIFPSISVSLVHIVPPNALNTFLHLQTKERPVGFLGLLNRKKYRFPNSFKDKC